MTAIIGYADGKNVWMVGDDVAGASSINECQRHSKVFIRNGNVIIGYTTSFRMGQLLQYATEFPVVKKDSDIHKYMCTDFVDTVLGVFEKAKYAKISEMVATGGTFLVGLFGRLFTVNDDFSVIEYSSPFAAVGCGYQYALASMETMWRFKPRTLFDEEHYVEMALKESLRTACKFSPNVRVHDESEIKVFKI